MGRDWKPENIFLFWNLEDDKEYTIAQIAATRLDPKKDKEEYNRLRNSIGSKIRYHEHFYESPDSITNNYRAWKGSRLKELLHEKDILMVQEFKKKLATSNTENDARLEEAIQSIQHENMQSIKNEHIQLSESDSMEENEEHKEPQLDSNTHQQESQTSEQPKQSEQPSFQENQKQDQKPKRRKLRLFGMAATVFIVLLFAGFSFSQWTEGQRPKFSEVSKQGLKKMIEYTSNHSEENVRDLLELAELEYRKGNMKRAEQLNFQALGHEKLTEALRATGLYQLGAIYADTNNLDQSLVYFDQAKDIFYQLQMKTAFIKTLYYHIKVLTLQERFEEAQKNLEYMKTISDDELSPLWYYRYADILTFQGKYIAAIEALETTLLSIEQNDDVRLAHTHSNLGFLYGMTGDIGKCMSHTQKANLMIFQFQDEKEYIYHQLNFIVLSDLLGNSQERNQSIQKINQWVTMKKDLRLKKYLEVAQGDKKTQ